MSQNNDGNIGCLILFILFILACFDVIPFAAFAIIFIFCLLFG